MFKLLSTIVRWMAHLARKRTKKKKKIKKRERDCIVQATESRPRVYGPGMGDEGSAPNFSKIWNFPGKQGNSSSGKKIIIINQQQQQQRLSFPNVRLHGLCQITVCSVNRWRELVDYAPINVKPVGGGGGGGFRGAGGQGMGWGFDIFQKFAVEFLPTGK